MPWQPKPMGSVTVTVDVYGDVRDGLVDLDKVQEAVEAELDGMDFDIDTADGTVLVWLSSS